MLGIGDMLPDFKVTGVKPGFHTLEENGTSAFEPRHAIAFRASGRSFSSTRRTLRSYALPRSRNSRGWLKISPIGMPSFLEDRRTMNSANSPGAATIPT